MCVKPNTPDYAECVMELAATTRQIAEGNAPPVTWLYRGGCFQNMHDLSNAIKDYSYALERQDELTAKHLAQVYDSRGVCFRQISKHAEAVADGERAVALQPNNARYFANLGFARMWAHDIEGAITDLTHSLELDASDSWAAAYRGMCYQRLEQYQKAIDDFSSIINDVPNASYMLFINRAENYMAVDRFEEAIADCNTAEKRADENDFRIFLIRGYSHFRLGNLAAALADLTWAGGLRKESGKIFFWRGMVFRAMGDEKAATEDMTRFSQLHPQGTAAAFSYMVETLSTLPAIPEAALVA